MGGYGTAGRIARLKAPDVYPPVKPGALVAYEVDGDLGREWARADSFEPAFMRDDASVGRVAPAAILEAS